MAVVRRVRARISKAEALVGLRLGAVVRYLAHRAEDAPSVPELPWAALLRGAVPVWLMTRALALVVTYASQTLLVASVVQGGSGASSTEGTTLNRIVTSWRLWDGGFYGRI